MLVKDVRPGQTVKDVMIDPDHSMSGVVTHVAYFDMDGSPAAGFTIQDASGETDTSAFLGLYETVNKASTHVINYADDYHTFEITSGVSVMVTDRMTGLTTSYPFPKPPAPRWLDLAFVLCLMAGIKSADYPHATVNLDDLATALGIDDIRARVADVVQQGYLKLSAKAYGQLEMDEARRMDLEEYQVVLSWHCPTDDFYFTLTDTGHTWVRSVTTAQAFADPTARNGRSVRTEVTN